jgi:hypothetical protein
MPNRTDQHVYLARLLAEARLRKGFRTIKEIYQSHQPTVDYQTWSCAESGRRIPHPNSLIEMAQILEIDKQDLLIAYSKDKFPDEESRQILNAFPISRFVDTESLLEAANHDNRLDVVLNDEQVDEMRKDIRLRLFLIYTYDQEFKTTFTRLEQFFDCDRSEAEYIIGKLAELGLVEIVGEEIKRIHKHTTIPPVPGAFDLRRQILLKTLDLNVKPTSYLANFHTFLTEDSFKKIMELIYFTRANIIRLEKEQKPSPTKRYQIVLVANIIDEGKRNERIT